MDNLVVCDDATGVKCKFSFHFLFHVDNLVVCVDATGVKCKFSFHFLFAWIIGRCITNFLLRNI